MAGLDERKRCYKDRMNSLQQIKDKKKSDDLIDKVLIRQLSTFKKDSDPTDEELRTFIEDLEVENELEGIEKDNVVGREL